MKKSLKTQIKELVQFAKTDKTPTNKEVEIGIVLNLEASKLKMKTGFELEGFIRVLDKYSIKHTIRKHGNNEIEKKRGQIAITDIDFELIPKIVKTENVIYCGKNKQGIDCILYEYVANDVFYYVEEIRTGKGRKKRLCLNTMYKRKPKNN